MARKKLLYLVGNLLLHIILYQFLQEPLQQLLFERSVTRQTLPGIYWFLLFPVGEAPIFSSPQFVPGQQVGTLTRAISADIRELDAGVIVVALPGNQRGYVRKDELRFLPGPDGAAQLERQKRFLAAMRMDTEFVAIPDAQGWHEVRYESLDHSHARSFVFRYRTNGSEIEPVSVRINSGILLLGFFASFFLTSYVLKSLWADVVAAAGVSWH